jgi:RimJ/RimL family protein N-acetyltransferase
MKIYFEEISKELQFVPFVPNKASEELWSAYFALTESVFSEFNPKSRLPNRSVTKHRLSVASALYSTQRMIILDESQTPVATVSFSYETEQSPSYELDKNVCYINMLIDKAFRRKRIATGLLKELLNTARQMKKNTIVAEVENIPGRKFCEALNGELAHKEDQHRLYMEDVNWDVIGEWQAKGRKKFPDTTFDFFRDCADADIDVFCSTYTEIINERPTGDMQQTIITTCESRRIEEQNLKKKGVEWYTLVSREKDGDISGMTDIMFHPKEPHKIVQYFTGVSAKHRRKGLAKRLKAEMLYVIKEKFPDAEYIKTTMAPDNRPMQAINAQMGFKSRKKSYVYQWALPDLKQRVEQRLASKKRRKRDYQTDSPA